MPSEEELKEALAQERADGWGIIEGIAEDDLLGLAGKNPESTLLESGQLLSHHSKDNCSGNCCIHGSSEYASCRMPRQWRHDRRILEHQCPHGVGHPCYAGVEYVRNIGGYADGVHGCDGCCVKIDNSPIDTDSILNEVDQYTLLQQAGSIGMLSEQLGWAQEDIKALQKRTWSLSGRVAIVSIAVFFEVVCLLGVTYILTR